MNAASRDRLCRDFRRNVLALQQKLHLAEPLTEPQLFYPELFDPSFKLQEFYGQQAKQSGLEETKKIRRYNNLVKVLLLEHFVDSMQGELRLLDLACGRGQDLQKYSREHRRCHVSSVLGVDFANEAVEEARRRYGRPATGL